MRFKIELLNHCYLQKYYHDFHKSYGYSIVYTNFQILLRKTNQNYIGARYDIVCTYSCKKAISKFAGFTVR